MITAKRPEPSLSEQWRDNPGSVIIGVLIGVPIVVALLVGMNIFDGYVVMKLWGWFIVPATNLAPIGLALACGLDLTFSLLSIKMIDLDFSSNKDGGRLFKLLWHKFASTAFALLIGWIITLFM